MELEQDWTKRPSKIMKWEKDKEYNVYIDESRR